MSEITITRPAQIALGLAAIGGLGAVVLAQLPEIQRYLKIRSM